MSKRQLIGLARELVVLIDGVGHAAAIVACTAFDVVLVPASPSDPVFECETTLFSPLCDQFGADGPFGRYDWFCRPDIRYAEAAGDGPVTCLACLSINVDEWFPPETEAPCVSMFGGA